MDNYPEIGSIWRHGDGKLIKVTGYDTGSGWVNWARIENPNYKSKAIVTCFRPGSTPPPLAFHFISSSDIALFHRMQEIYDGLDI